MMIASFRMAVRPEKQDEFLQTIRGILEPTEVEPGCISIRFYRDHKIENAFALIEEWKTREHLEEHFRRETFRRLLLVMDLLSEPPEVNFHTVSGTSGFEIIKMAFEQCR